MLLTVEAQDSFGAIEVLLVRVVLFSESPFLSILHDYLQKIQVLFTLLDLFSPRF